MSKMKITIELTAENKNLNLIPRDINAWVGIQNLGDQINNTELKNFRVVSTKIEK